MADTPPDKQHVSRVGISRGDVPVGNLGDAEHSFGYDGETGNYLDGGTSAEYGNKFGKGNTIYCLVDLESEPYPLMEFSRNKERLPAITFKAGLEGIRETDSPARKLPWASALFPHVLLKNTEVKFLFSEEQGLGNVGEYRVYRPWNSALKDGKAILGPASSQRQHCEVIIMVGLPASGKTYWAENRVKEDPEKRYILLGTNLALDKMKVPASTQKFNDDEYYDLLMSRASLIFNTLCSMAAEVPRNYIIDHRDNVFEHIRKKILMPFTSFRKIAVVVFPTLGELEVRAKKRFEEPGKEVSRSELREILEKFVFPMSKGMPETNEDFDEVRYSDLSRSDAQQHLKEMKDGKLYSSRYSTMKFPYPNHSSVSSGGSLIGQSEPAFSTNPANVNIGDTGAVQHDTSGSTQPLPNNVNIGNTEVGQPDALGSTQPISNNVNRGYSWGQQPGVLGYTRVGQPNTLGSMQPISDNVNIGYPWAQQPNIGYPWAQQPNIAYPWAQQPYSCNVAMGYTGARQPDALQSMQPSSNTVRAMPEISVYPRRLEPSAESYFQFGSLNPMPPTNYYPGSYPTYNNPVPQENRSYPITYPGFRVPVPRNNNLAQYGTYMHDFLGTHRATYSYGTPGYENYAQDTRSAYQPPHVSQHGTPNPMPQRSYPANGHGQHHGFAPYSPRPPR